MNYGLRYLETIKILVGFIFSNNYRYADDDLDSKYVNDDVAYDPNLDHRYNITSDNVNLPSRV